MTLAQTIECNDAISTHFVIYWGYMRGVKPGLLRKPCIQCTKIYHPKTSFSKYCSRRCLCNFNYYINPRNRLRSVFHGIQKRCRTHPDYAGRSIRCEWPTLDEFIADMAQTFPAHIHDRRIQIDRINNNGNYNKQNCRWTTAKINARNRRSNILIEYDGQRKTLAEWADQAVVRYWVFWRRVRSLHWPMDKALTVPLGGHLD